jgi:cardiolipin synthase A/B
LATATKSRPRRSKQQPDDGPLAREFERSEALRIVAVVAMIALLTWILAALFAPGPKYSLAARPDAPVQSDAFVNQLEPLVNSDFTRDNTVDVLPNGENFYEAELQAMRQAQHSVNIEAYIFHRGEVTRRVLEVLTERARAGVHVNLVLDAVGSLSTPKHYFKALRDAGGRVAWYHPVRWNNWFRSNNRTHREITIVDGRIGFIGGAGYADWWRYAKGKSPSWRDTMFRVQGPIVAHLQGTLTENMLESLGEILNGPDYFPPPGPNAGRSPAMVVTSTPSAGGSTPARILFQLLIASARRTIYITTPYYLPEENLQKELGRALQRGVEIKIIVPGKHSDHSLTRSSGRAAYGSLLESGGQVYEYDAAMIHAKILIVDETWCVVGSTNFDNRSFGINDEVSVAVRDAKLAAQLTSNFQEDISQSRQVMLREWNNRSLYERALEIIGWVLERQQ